MTEPATATRGREHGRDRRRALVRIAYHHIATRGLEGLRVRAVAGDAGINHATLLHYFPTKEALIQGVVEDLLEQFRVSRVPRPAAPTPLEELRLEFADIRQRLREEPELAVVLTELLARARRDSAVARPLRMLDDTWHGFLSDLLRRGIAAGAFRADVDPGLAAWMLMVQIKGLIVQTLSHDDPAQTDALVAELAVQAERALRR